ncbi:MAG: hypothetical protein WBA76_12780 [Phormidesmis sp.]
MNAYITQLFGTRDAESTNDLPFRIIFWLSMYTPFEEFFLRWLPNPIAVPLRFVPELILYGLALKVCGSKILRGDRLKKTPIDLWVAAFFVATAISMVLNGSGPRGSLLNMRTIWRYLSVFYIAVNIDISKSELKRMLSGLKVVMVIQAFIGSIQYFLPARVNLVLFAPKGFQIGGYNGTSNASSGGLKVGATAGTFSDPAVLSAFMLIGLALFFASSYVGSSPLLPARWVELRDLALLLFSTFATKKRAALLIALFIPLVTIYVYGKSKKLANIGWFYGAIGLVGILAIISLGAVSNSSLAGVDERETSVSLSAYFLQIFSADYWQQSNEAARGWFMNVILDTLITTRSWFGLGPDFWHALNIIEATTLRTGEDIDKLYRDAGVFDDGFWFAFLAYFGIVGTLIYGIILKRLYDASKWLARVASEPEYKTLGAMFATVIVVTVFYTFVERTLRLRAFSFYFWLLAGLVINACHVKIAAIKQARSSGH